MSSTTATCERCGRKVQPEAAQYSTAGQLVCRECLAVLMMGDADARGAAAKRRVRTLLIVTAALVVLVPGAMFAAGLGKIVAHTVVIAGVLALFGGSSARRMFVSRTARPDPTVVRGTTILLVGGLLVLFLGLFLEGKV